MKSFLEKLQPPSIDCYLIFFLHQLSPLKEDLMNFNEIKALIKVQIKDDIQHTNSIIIDNKNFFQINQNLIYPLSLKELKQNQKDYSIQISLCNMFEKQSDNIIATCLLDIDQNIYEKQQQKKWICLHSKNQYSKIQTFIEISQILVNINDINKLPYKWDFYYKEEIQDISVKNIPGNYNINFEEFQFSFFLAEQIKQDLFGCKLILKYTDKEIVSLIDTQEFSCIFKFPVVIPFVNKKIEFFIKDQQDNIISIIKQDLTNYFIIETEADYALSFFHINKKYFLGRFSFNFVKKQMNQNKLALFQQEKLISSRREMYLLNLDDKENFYLTFQIELISNIFDIKQDLILSIEWGQLKQDINIKKNSNKILFINKVLHFIGKFYFVNESIDFLPEVLITLKNEEDQIINFMYIQSSEIPFSSQCKFPLTFNKQMETLNNIYKPINIQLKCNFHNELQNKIDKINLQKQLTKYYLIDLIAIKGINQSEQKLIFVHLNKEFQYSFTSDKYFQWIKKELIFKNDIYENISIPFTFCIQNKFETIYRDYHIQDNLEGIPQWVQINEKQCLLISIKKFNTLNHLQKYLNLQNQENELFLKNKIDQNEIVVQDFKIELESKKIRLNFFKIEDISSNINLLKFNNPALKLNLDSFVYDNRSYNQDQYRIITPQIPQKYQKINTENDTIYIKQEVELELEIPKDKRLLQTIQINILQRNSDDDINLGNINLDLFDLYFTNQLNLYRKLRDLQEAFEAQDFKNKKEVLKVIYQKMLEIEYNFTFVEEFQPVKNRQYETLDNMLEKQIQLKKNQNYFHRRKEELIQKANGLSENQKLRFSNLPGKNSSSKFSSPLVNINNLVVYLEDQPSFQQNVQQENYRLVAKHTNQKAHWRFEEQKELEYSDFMFSDKQWSKFELQSDIIEQQGKLQCTMNIQQQDDDYFFNILKEYGIDISLLKNQNFKYKKFQPNQKIKMRLYLTDLILKQNKNDDILFEVYLDNTLIEKKSIKNKKEIKKKQKIIGLEINEKIKNCFTLGTYQNLKIIFYRQNEKNYNNFEELGRTEIDINRRLNCNIWRNLTQVPIEKRSLSKQDSLIQQGYIKLWLEMFTKDQKISFPDYEISQYSQEKIHEVRVVIWSIENLGNSWGFKNTDNYLRVSMNTEIFPYELDEKYSYQNQFTDPIKIKNSQQLVTINHRFIWRFKLDGFRKNFNSLLNIKIANDFEQYEIDRKLDFTNQLETVIKQKQGRRSVIDDKQELLCFSEENPQGVKILITLDILNEEDISRKPAGLGRNYPNANPYLPDPNDQINEETIGFMGFSNKQFYWLVVAFFTCFTLTLISTYVLTRILV